MTQNKLVNKFPGSMRNKPRTFVDDITEDLWDAYSSDERPWIVGFSGGKDSTMLVKLIYYAMVKLPKEERKKPTHIIASDTRVEIPSIEKRIRKELESIASAAERDELPISTHLVYPKLNDTEFKSKSV